MCYISIICWIYLPSKDTESGKGATNFRSNLNNRLSGWSGIRTDVLLLKGKLAVATKRSTFNGKEMRRDQIKQSIL